MTAQLRRVLLRGSRASYAICKLCHHGIYDHQQRVWLADPAGLSHTDCARREGRA